MNLLQRLGALFGAQPPQPVSPPDPLHDKIDALMPGQALCVTIKGRRYAIIEEDVFEIIMQRAGMRITEPTAPSIDYSKYGKP